MLQWPWKCGKHVAASKINLQTTSTKHKKEFNHMLFTQLFEDDFNNKKPLVETHDDYEDCSYCSGTGEGRYEGQSCSHCGGSGVEPAEQDDDDFDIPDEPDDFGDEESYYEKSLRSRGLGEGADERKQNALWAQITDYEKRAKATKNDIKKAHYEKMANELRGKLKTNVDEGVNNVGANIKALYRKIYNAGDDEIEYFYNDSPIFAQYWDEYEGDLDSIIAEVDPGELQVMLDELESYVQQAGLAEGIGKDMAKLGGIAALGIGAGLGANYVDQQQPRIEVGGQKAYLIQHPGWGRVPDNAMTLQGKDGKTYTVWASKGKGSTQYYATPADNVKEGVAEGLSDTQKKIEDTINKLEDRLKHAKSDEQWDRISARIERLQAGLNRSKKGVAEGGEWTKLPNGNWRNMHTGVQQSTPPKTKRVVQGTNLKTVAKADLGKNPLNLPAGYGDVVQPQGLKDVEETRVGNRLSDIEIGSPKVVYYKGKAVGEVGIDHEASPGNGPYYMKHYLTGKDMVGYDTKREALADLKYLVQQMDEGVAEAKKKDELEPEIRDVGLQRAISNAKAAFPAAGSGIEALSKDFMRSQEQDQKSFDQIRQAERRQNQMLDQIAQLDQSQTQEIQSLEKQNSGLASRLQQLQAVNDNLEKKLAAMSGRKPKAVASEPATISKAVEPVVSTIPAPASAPVQSAPAKPKQPTTSPAIGQVAKALSGPATSPAFDRMSQELQPRQKELGFDEPVTLKPKKFDTTKASDADYRELTSKLAKDIASNPARQVFNPDAVKSVAAQQEMPVENNDQDQKIAGRYDPDEFDAMVARVGQKARKQEKKKPVDIKDLARRLAAVKLPGEK
jgi:hypothetical protein